MEPRLKSESESVRSRRTAVRRIVRYLASSCCSELRDLPRINTTIKQINYIAQTGQNAAASERHRMQILSYYTPVYISAMLCLWLRVLYLH